jgi:outer membrane lipoprotein SlyB
MCRLARGLLVALGLAAGFGACTTPDSARVYSRDEAKRAWTVSEGRVVDVKPAQIEGRRSALGTLGGGYVGYEVGRSIGHGHGSDIAGAFGAVAGAAAGQAVEEGVTRQDALQITVDLDHGDTIAVVQAADVAFTPGDRVKILRRGDGAARVSKL